MAKIKCIFVSSLANIIAKKELIIDIPNKTTIKKALGVIRDSLNNDFEEKIYSKSGELNKYIIILLNGIDIRKIDGLNTEIINGDKISLVPAIAGG